MEEITVIRKEVLYVSFLALAFVEVPSA